MYEISKCTRNSSGCIGKRVADLTEQFIKVQISVSKAFALLYAVRQEGDWASRVSFVYSVNEQAVYYIENNCFENIKIWLC